MIWNEVFQVCPSVDFGTYTSLMHYNALFLLGVVV